MKKFRINIIILVCVSLFIMYLIMKDNFNEIVDNLLNAPSNVCTAVFGDNPSFELFPPLDTNITFASCHTAFKLVTVLGISSYIPQPVALYPCPTSHGAAHIPAYRHCG